MLSATLCFTHAGPALRTKFYWADCLSTWNCLWTLSHGRVVSLGSACVMRNATDSLVWFAHNSYAVSFFYIMIDGNLEQLVLKLPSRTKTHKVPFSKTQKKDESRLRTHVLINTALLFIQPTENIFRKFTSYELFWVVFVL